MKGPTCETSSFFLLSKLILFNAVSCERPRCPCCRISVVFWSRLSRTYETIHAGVWSLRCEIGGRGFDDDNSPSCQVRICYNSTLVESKFLKLLHNKPTEVKWHLCQLVPFDVGRENKCSFWLSLRDLCFLILFFSIIRIMNCLDKSVCKSPAFFGMGWGESSKSTDAYLPKFSGKVKANSDETFEFWCEKTE